MFVHRWMTIDVIHISPDTLVSDALFQMEDLGIKRLPVLDGDTMVGITHRNDLIRTLFLERDDPAVEQLMIRNVLSTHPEAPLEEAALLMDQHNVGGLPVMKGDRLAGIITESDVFKAFVQVMGLLEGGQRITIRVKDRPGALIEALKPIQSQHLNIISVASYQVPGAPPGTKEITLRLQTTELSMLVGDLLRHRVDVVDWR